MRKKQRALTFILFSIALGLAWPRLAGQERPAANDAVREADHAIMAEVKDHNEIMKNLEYLTDHIGARLTGSDKLTQASRWTQQMFTGYGLSNVHLESWTIAHAWTRGTASARLVSPVDKPITLAAVGWSPPTPGAVRGPIVYVQARRIEDLEKYKGKLKGGIVIGAPPSHLPQPYETPENPMLVPPGRRFVLPQPPPAPGEPAQPPQNFFGPGFRQFLAARDKFFKDEGVAAVLRDSDKPHGLLNMTGIGGRDFNIGPLPSAFVTSEDYSLIWRLLQQGPVEVEINLTCSFSDQPVEVYNTVAEIPGTEKPDEVVILGGHLDSWDLGTGATDNGTGSMVVLEAARALQKLGGKPKRTIRFLLFTGEEEGLVGSRAYVAAHPAEMAKISGVLIHDTGTGRVLSLAMMDNYQDLELIDRVISPLHELGVLEPSMRRETGSDHVSFDAAGVPAYFCIQDPAEYPKTHHSQSDTFDKVCGDDLVQGAEVLAVWAYNVAQLPDMLPRRLRQPAVTRGADEP